MPRHQPIAQPQLPLVRSLVRHLIIIIIIITIIIIIIIIIITLSMLMLAIRRVDRGTALFRTCNVVMSGLSMSLLLAQTSSVKNKID